MSEGDDKPFTFRFGDGPEVTADELPEEQQGMASAIAEFMGSLGVEGIVFADDEEEDE